MCVYVYMCAQYEPPPPRVGQNDTREPFLPLCARVPNTFSDTIAIPSRCIMPVKLIYNTSTIVGKKTLIRWRNVGNNVVSNIFSIKLLPTKYSTVKNFVKRVSKFYRKVSGTEITSIAVPSKFLLEPCCNKILDLDIQVFGPRLENSR